MELEKMSTVVAIGEEEIESDDVQETAAEFGSGVGEEVSLEFVEEVDMVSDSSEEELFTCVRTFCRL